MSPTRSTLILLLTILSVLALATGVRETNQRITRLEQRMNALLEGR